MLFKTTVSTVADKELKQTYCGLYYKTSQIPFSENRRKFKEKFTDQFSRQLFFPKIKENYHLNNESFYLHNVRNFFMTQPYLFFLLFPIKRNP